MGVPDRQRGAGAPVDRTRRHKAAGVLVKAVGGGRSIGTGQVGGGGHRRRGRGGAGALWLGGWRKARLGGTRTAPTNDTDDDDDDEDNCDDGGDRDDDGEVTVFEGKPPNNAVHSVHVAAF